MEESTTAKRVYWHQELPPLADRIESEHELVAKSDEAALSMGDRHDLWGHVYPSLRANIESRLEQEVQRQGGDCAHVVHEEITEHEDFAKSVYYLQARIEYVLYLPPA